MNCPSCGAALAEDQRYCLNCGQRQGEPRVEFHRHLEAKVAAPTAGAQPNEGASKGAAPPAESKPAAGQPPEKPPRDYAPLAAAGGIAVLGVMLLIGVLIGRGTGSEPSTAAPQVITVGAPESSAGEGAGRQREAGGRGGNGGGEASGSKGAKDGSGKPQNAAAGSPDTGNAPVASDETLEALQQKTGADYAKESAKLPDEIATPGEAPPTDGKAPGGGSGGTTIE